MNFKNTVGIDISKLTLDVADHLNHQHFKEINTTKRFRPLIKQIIRSSDCPLEDLLICFEHTGIYSLPLASFLAEQGIKFIMVPGLEVKRSLGIQRGKSDKVDARSLARYAYRIREEVEPTVIPSQAIIKLKNYLALRVNLVKHRAAYLKITKEYKQFSSMSKQDLFFKSQERMIRQLTKEIKAVEQAVKEQIESDTKINEQYKLLTSVKGVGLILAVNLLVTTNCFTRFKNWRQYACYSGTAPFEYQSGTSLKGRTKVNHFANKTMKSLLNQAALVSVRHDPEIRAYYEKQVEKGKNKMSVLNAVRNKLIARVFAVINRGTPFVVLNKFAA